MASPARFDDPFVAIFLARLGRLLELERSLADGINMRVPRLTPNGDEWKPYSPAGTIPYAHNWRLFRTPNDAFLAARTHRHCEVGPLQGEDVVHTVADHRDVVAGRAQRPHQLRLERRRYAAEDPRRGDGIHEGLGGIVRQHYQGMGHGREGTE